jgi:CIC family chloride channel protein
MVKFAASKAGEVGLNVTEEDLIRESRAKDLADADIPVIPENSGLRDILRIFAERDNLYYPVVNENGVLTGILPIEKLKDTFIASDIADFLLAHDIMEPAEFRCTGATEATDVIDMFKHKGVASIPVTDENGTVTGMIEYRRMQRFFARRIAELHSKASILEEQ